VKSPAISFPRDRDVASCGARRAPPQCGRGWACRCPSAYTSAVIHATISSGSSSARRSPSRIYPTPVGPSTRPPDGGLGHLIASSAPRKKADQIVELQRTHVWRPWLQLVGALRGLPFHRSKAFHAHSKVKLRFARTASSRPWWRPSIESTPPPPAAMHGLEQHPREHRARCRPVTALPENGNLPIANWSARARHAEPSCAQTPSRDPPASAFAGLT